METEKTIAKQEAAAEPGSAKPDGGPAEASKKKSLALSPLRPVAENDLVAMKNKRESRIEVRVMKAIAGIAYSQQRII